MIRIPYGLSNFSAFAKEGYHYVDRTNYIEVLEKLGEKYIFIVRPRRFGKSLFISTLHHYYDLVYQEQFKDIFGKYYIGQHPTPLANSYLVLRLSFAGIHTDSPNLTLRGFLGNVKYGVRNLMYNYRQWFSETDIAGIEPLTMPSEVILYLLNVAKAKNIPHKLYVLIDEYDHFANELLAFDFTNFKNIVSKNGFVRKFYETLKEGTVDMIERIFITGVTPITLDSLTSGFNIASKLTTDVRLNEMFGFTKKEVATILTGIGVETADMPRILEELAFWYNGYLFNEDAPNRVYNPDMILFFAKQYISKGKYPKDLLDTNIASDYRKVRNLFKLDGKEAENIAIIKDLLIDGTATAYLTREYSFEKIWTQADLVSLLFYQGILTIQKERLGRLIFEIPNAVIRQLYFQYFQQITLEELDIRERELKIWDRVEQLALYNNITPLMDLTQDILAQLAIEDRAHYNELTFKVIFTSLFYTTNIFKIYSELEVRKSKTTKGRVDLLLLERPPFEIPNQFVFELKYVRKKEMGRWKTTKTNAIKQLTAYLKHDRGLQQTVNLRAYVLMFSIEKQEAIAL